MNPLSIELLLPRWRRWRRGMPLADGKTQDATRFVTTRGGLARVQRTGRGPALVWLPDPPVIIEHYQSLVTQLAPHFDVTFVELPGIGFGMPNKSFDFSIASAGANLVDALEALDLREATLVGTCLGGYAAQAAANLALDRVARVVFLQTPSWPDGQRWLERRDPKSILRTPWIGQALFQTMAARRTADWFRYALADPSAANTYAATARSALSSGACFCLASLFQQFLAPAQPLPHPVSQPALAIAGLRDRSHQGTNWSLAATLGRQVEVLGFDECGHFPDLEANERIVATLRSFVASH
jgi:pimeloyl-ACP methyl ester carboxylesterase